MQARWSPAAARVPVKRFMAGLDKSKRSCALSGSWAEGGTCRRPAGGRSESGSRAVAKSA